MQRTPPSAKKLLSSPGETGRLYSRLEGSLNGVAGRFEWIIEKGAVTHRMFVGGGTVTGVPIVP
jgi:filamentous hemagglutinin